MLIHFNCVKVVEEEAAKRIELLVKKRVEEELEKRKDEIEQEVAKRVEEAKRKMEKEMMEELERQREQQRREELARQVTDFITYQSCVLATQHNVAYTHGKHTLRQQHYVALVAKHKCKCNI